MAKTYTVGAGGQTFYVDDRDFDDTDDSDGQAGGIWIYQEANGLGGLQRGGSQWVVAAIPVTLPYVAPTPVYTPAVGPAPSKGTTLFPTGFGGGSVADAAGEHDDCIEYDGAGHRLPADQNWF